jgi:BirA family biotin operon repressor/biotin-[acetyl-CoA-carboxylase] ligase
VSETATTPENLILRELLAAGEGWVSGTRLAAQLKISRVAVWHHLEKLRAEGFSFEGQPARGYRLAGRPDRLSGPLIEAQLKIRPKDFSVLVLEEIDSTNDEAASCRAFRRAGAAADARPGAFRPGLA